MSRLSVILFVLCLAAPQAPSAVADDEALTQCPATQARTVFVPDATMRRHDGSATRLTDAHREAENGGWQFEDLEIYIENGDLQGFFVTYTRPHPCNG